LQGSVVEVSKESLLTGVYTNAYHSNNRDFRGEWLRLGPGLFARPLAILPDAAHSQRENRFCAIGRTEKGRGVFIIFTLRHKGDELLIRPLSARYMHKKEIEAHEKENPDL
jgi:uncharacterized DUF497 family protein